MKKVFIVFLMVVAVWSDSWAVSRAWNYLGGDMAGAKTWDRLGSAFGPEGIALEWYVKESAPQPEIIIGIARCFPHAVI